MVDYFKEVTFRRLHKPECKLNEIFNFVERTRNAGESRIHKDTSMDKYSHLIIASKNNTALETGIREMKYNIMLSWILSRGMETILVYWKTHWIAWMRVVWIVRSTTEKSSNHNTRTHRSPIIELITFQWFIPSPNRSGEFQAYRAEGVQNTSIGRFSRANDGKDNPIDQPEFREVSETRKVCAISFEKYSLLAKIKNIVRYFYRFIHNPRPPDSVSDILCCWMRKIWHQIDWNWKLSSRFLRPAVLLFAFEIQILTECPSNAVT